MKVWSTRILATFFYLGYLPVAPGTFGTIGAIALYYLVSHFSPLIYLLFLLAFIILSVWVSDEVSSAFGDADPSSVVIDEVSGFLVTMFLLPFSLLNIVLGFLFFRFFDIMKPPPIRRLERLPGGYGIVGDDMLAGIYANIVLQIVTRLIG